MLKLCWKLTFRGLRLGFQGWTVPFLFSFQRSHSGTLHYSWTWTGRWVFKVQFEVNLPRPHWVDEIQCCVNFIGTPLIRYPSFLQITIGIQFFYQITIEILVFIKKPSVSTSQRSVSCTFHWKQEDQATWNCSMLDWHWTLQCRGRPRVQSYIVLL